MITAADLEFHTPPDAGHTWAETYFFPIAIPEEHLLITVYVVARPGLDVMVNDVMVYGALADSRAELLYFDVQPHLPGPERFSAIDSPSGLQIRAVDPPRDYRIDYAGYDGMEIHVDWRGIMEPFDIHDPAHSPRASADVSSQHAGSGLGAAWGGHFDMSGRVTGQVSLRGTEYAVDCVERMDHSWGHRNPIAMNAQDSISAAFGPDLALHVIAQLDPDAPGGSDATFRHGYILQDGEVHGLVDCELTVTRSGLMVAALELAMTDVRGEVFHMHALPDVGAPWSAYAATVTYTGMMRWLYKGRVGYGCVMETWGLAGLTRRRGRDRRAPQPRVTSG